MGDEIDVRYVARLARIALTDDEVERFGTQLRALLEHVAVLNKLDVADIAATAQVVESRNVVRDDAPMASLASETLLEQAPRSQGAFVRVPRILTQ
ncbi:MAG: Asp-tRNA(Asn)/Glu-tRNA(Gln) amidotransferase subunit GatC [Candidatus Tyrphobacter sp.]